MRDHTQHTLVGREYSNGAHFIQMWNETLEVRLDCMNPRTSDTQVNSYFLISGDVRTSLKVYHVFRCTRAQSFLPPRHELTAGGPAWIRHDREAIHILWTQV